jgi:hypothetical protein
MLTFLTERVYLQQMLCLEAISEFNFSREVGKTASLKSLKMIFYRLFALPAFIRDTDFR